METFDVFLLSLFSSFLLMTSPLFHLFSFLIFLLDFLFSSFFSLSPRSPFSFSTFYLLVTFFFLTGTGKDKSVWAAMASFQGKCEALGKIDLSFLPNIDLI